MISEEIKKKAANYIQNETSVFFRKQIEELLASENEKELNDRFYQELDFGTGGMRGEIGGGTNRMNPFMIHKATQGLANYVKNSGEKTPAAVIAYDSRNFSDMFAEEAALVLAANGIKTYLFTSLRPTPELSFAVRQLKATTGIVVTASHNPKEYNGYKVYWNDGGQVVAPHDNGIIQEVRSVQKIQRMEKKDALSHNLLCPIDKEIDDAFMAAVKQAAIRPEMMRENGKKLKVVYTPLHGTGAMPVSRALHELGIDVVFVEEQKNPDGNFPTAKSPNPEEAVALEMALALAKKISADLVMATDPDADRLGIAVPDAGSYVLMSGNQLGALLADYAFSSLKEAGRLPAKPLFIKTIVTTEMQRKIAEKYGAQCLDVLTGFKFIGEKIREYEALPDGPRFVIGGEESYGYLVHTAARDKDAVSAATLTAEMVLYQVIKGKSLMDRLRELWKEFGYYEEILISKQFKGQAGGETMARMMEGFRKNPPAEFAERTVLRIKDYRSGTTMEMRTGNSRKDIDLPSSNVVQIILDDETVITARPSGTEPKIKFYASCHSAPGMELTAAKQEVEKKISKIKAEIELLIKKP